MRSAAHGILLLAIISVDCAVAAWPAQVETATFESPADGSEQKTLVYLPPAMEFRGGHEIVHEAALTWLEAQRRGESPNWKVPPHVPPVLAKLAAASGR